MDKVTLDEAALHKATAFASAALCAGADIDTAMRYAIADYLEASSALRTAHAAGKREGLGEAAAIVDSCFRALANAPSQGREGGSHG